MTLKRCISTAYYAFFSLLVHAASSMLAGNSAGRKELRGYIARAFSHNEMAEACKGFAGGNLNKGLKPCLQSASSTDLKDIAATFRSLQQSRHDADYNILQKPKKKDARQAIQDVNRHRKLHHFRHRKVSHPRPGLVRRFRTGSALGAPAVPLFVHGLCGWLRWLSSVIDAGGTSPAVTPQAFSAGIGGGASPIPAEEEPPACGRNSPDRRFSLSR